MLEKKARLSKNKEFDNVWQNGRSSFDGLLGVKAVPNDIGCNRFGILVGLKVGKRAVDRNVLKRRIREAIRSFSSELKKGFDIVVVSLPPAKDKELSELKASLYGGFKKLRLLI